LSTHAANRSAFGDRANLTRATAHGTRQAEALHRSTRSRLDAPTKSGPAQSPASGDGTASACAILVRAHHAVRIARLGGHRWLRRTRHQLGGSPSSRRGAPTASRCAPCGCASFSTAALRSSRAAARAAGSRKATVRAAAGSRRAAAVAACGIATGSGAAYGGARRTAVSGRLSTLRASASNAQRERSDDCQRSWPSAPACFTNRKMQRIHRAPS
jgi:hypothetical protein